MAGDERVLDGVRVVELAGDVGGRDAREAAGRDGRRRGQGRAARGIADAAPIGPFAHDRLDADHSLTFWYYNTNKRSVVIDYRTTEGRDELGRLAAGADVFISTLAPPELRRARDRPRRAAGCRTRAGRGVDHAVRPRPGRGPTASAPTSSASPSATRSTAAATTTTRSRRSGRAATRPTSRRPASPSWA